MYYALRIRENADNGKLVRRLSREEIQEKIEMVNQLAYKKDYKGQLELVRSIDWKKVKDAHALYIAGEVYAANKLYQESKEIFLMAYSRLPVRKNILYRLVEVSLKTEEFEDAWSYYQRFLEAAPNDDIHYVLKYKICSAQGSPLEELIQILEEYKERDYTERWSYELARLYYKAGEEKKCVETCDDIVLWFSEGIYVRKALELKQRLTDLTPRQKDIYETIVRQDGMQRQPAAVKKKEGEGPQPLEEEEIKSSSILNEGRGDDMAHIVENNDTLQEKITKGIKDIFSGIVKEWEGDDDILESYPGTPKINIADVIPLQQVEESIREKEEVEKETEGEGTDPGPVRGAAEEGTEGEGTDPGPIQGAVEEEIGGEGDIPEPVRGAVEEEIGGEGDIPEPVRDEPEERSEGEETDPGPVPEVSEKVSGEASQEGFDVNKLPRLELPEFNLEEMILSAAEKQGIEVPDEIEEKVKVEDGEEPEPEISDPEEGPPRLVTDKIQPEGEIRPQEEILSEEESLIQFIEAKDAQEEAEQGTIVPRCGTLDDTEIKLFSYFSTIPGMKEQLVEALADAQMAASDKTSRSGNIIVMGNQRTGKTRLIESLIKAICRELHMPAVKIAIVGAAQLNDKNMPKIVSKLSGGFLVIKKVSQLAADNVFQLDQAMEFRTDGLTVILEDEKIGMRKFIAKYQKFAKKFTSTINIPVFTNDELVHFAKIYADEMGYVMDTMGVLALYNLIGDNQKEDEPMTIGTVKDMMDLAITKAESGHRKLQRSISKKRFDDEGKIVLYEKDFK